MRVLREAPRGPDVPDIRRSALSRGTRGPNLDGNVFACCPFCLEKVGKEDDDFKLTIKISGETRPKKERPPLTLSPERGVYACYRCHSSGLGDFSWLGIDVPEAAAPGAPSPLDEDLADARANFVPLRDAAQSSVLRQYVDYVRARGVWDAAVAAGAGAVNGGKYRRRILIPVAARAGGPWVGFQARAIDGREPRYLGPRRMDRINLLMGLEHLPPGKAYVMEGPFDLLSLFPRALAPLGTGVTDEQVERMAGLGRRLVVCLDGDAWRAARALALRLRLRGADATWCHLPPATDPAQLGGRVDEYEQAGA